MSFFDENTKTFDYRESDNDFFISLADDVEENLEVKTYRYSDGISECWGQMVRHPDDIEIELSFHNFSVLISKKQLVDDLEEYFEYNQNLKENIICCLSDNFSHEFKKDDIDFKIKLDKIELLNDDHFQLEFDLDYD